MTYLESLQALSDADLIVKVAELMGYERHPRVGIFGQLRFFTNRKGVPQPEDWDPLTDWNHTMQIVKHIIANDSFSFSLDSYFPRWLAKFVSLEDDRPNHQVKENDPQRAIVLAAILAASHE